MSQSDWLQQKLHAPLPSATQQAQRGSESLAVRQPQLVHVWQSDVRADVGHITFTPNTLVIAASRITCNTELRKVV